jgi:diamine N-acetyltransferase
VITRKEDKTVLGLVDLFDFNPHHQRAGIGILIIKKHQHNGYALNALEVFLRYAFEHLDIHQLYANIPVSNKNSLRLFEKLNFNEVGIQKDWIKVKGKYQHVALLQLINPIHL